VAEVLEEMLLLLHDKNFHIDTTTHLPPRASKIPG
jgi:chromosome segregation ATPase